MSCKISILQWTKNILSGQMDVNDIFLFVLDKMARTKLLSGQKDEAFEPNSRQIYILCHVSAPIWATESYWTSKWYLKQFRLPLFYAKSARSDHKWARAKYKCPIQCPDYKVKLPNLDGWFWGLRCPLKSSFWHFFA